jgi:glycosyltransferase involved in cell wall biosynthesis
MTWRPKKTIVKTIPSGVPIPSRVADPTGPLRIVYAGRLEERQKRIGATVSALIDSMARHPELTVKIIGEGSHLPSVQRQVAESGYKNRFQLTGYIPPQDLHNEILDGNVFVLLSDFEGLPGGVMDAMACGLVPVCSDIPGGVRELVVHEQTGLLITDRENSFQAAISRLNAEPQLRTRLSANARKHIEQGFSLTIVADRWEELFRQAMAASGPRLPISFPKRILLPEPYAGIAREDIRRPPFFRRAIQVSLALPGRTARWVTSGLSNKH